MNNVMDCLEWKMHVFISVGRTMMYFLIGYIHFFIKSLKYLYFCKKIRKQVVVSGRIWSINPPTSSKYNRFYRSLLLKPTSLISRHLEVHHVISSWRPSRTSGLIVIVLSVAKLTKYRYSVLADNFTNHNCKSS